MGIIKDFLFGRKIVIQNSRIGNLTTRVRDSKPFKIYTWTSECIISHQPAPTVFLWEANIHGPNRRTLDNIYKIIDSLDDIISQIKKDIEFRPKDLPKYKQPDWINNFYLSYIGPSEPESLILKYEIIFESIHEENTDTISLYWENGKMSEIVFM